jgi:hypothetical protein
MGLGTRPCKKPPAPSLKRRPKKPDVVALIAAEISKVLQRCDADKDEDVLAILEAGATR